MINAFCEMSADRPSENHPWTLDPHETKIESHQTKLRRVETGPRDTAGAGRNLLPYPNQPPYVPTALPTVEPERDA